MITTRYDVARTFHYHVVGPHGWYPEDQTDFIRSYVTQEDSRWGTRRKRPVQLWRNPASYGRTIYSNWDFLDETVVHDYFWDPGIYCRVSWSGRNTHSGYVWREVPPVPSYLVEKALTKARLKLKNQDINLSQAFAERKLTADLVVSNFKRLAGAAIALKRGRFGDAARKLGISKRLFSSKDFFNDWLQLQYGWKPLVSDVYGAVSALSDKEESRSGNGAFRVTGVGLDYQDYSRSVSETTGNGYARFYWNERDEFRSKVTLWYEQTNPTFAKAASLGLTNPLALAWELLPFSFVVDWALPVGNFFNQLDASFGFQFVSGTLSDTTRCTRSNVLGLIEGDVGPSLERTAYANSNNARAFRFNRTVYTTEPYAVIPVPKFLTGDEIGSAAHVENAIALLAQAFVSPRR